MYAVAGLAGSGKSVATGVADSLGYSVVPMGQVVRERARGVLGDDASSEEIGVWAAQQRELRGSGIIAELTADRIVERYDPSEVVVDGLRSPDEVKVLKERFGTISVVLVTAPFDTRLRRLQARGRDGEDAFDAEDLRERDRREEAWGLSELEADAVLVNDGAVEEFELAVGDMIGS